MQNLNNRPNIVLFLFDSLGTDDYHTLAGNLPHLEALRGRSLWFSKAYCGCPEGSPARASLLTGLDMAAHGVWTNGVSLPAHETIISERFTQSGYQSWLFGRRQLAGVANWTTEHTRPGEYRHVDWAHGPLHRSRQNAYLAWLEATAGATYNELFPTQANPDSTDIPPQQRQAMAEISDELSFNTWIGASLNKRLIQHTSDQPFLAVAGFVVGESMGAETSKQHVSDVLDQPALQLADTAIGSVLQTLESEGLTDNTVVVLASACGSIGYGRDDQDLHERAIKVPIMISAANHEAGCIDDAVSTMDLAPTLYQIAGVEAPPRIQGRSLLTAEPRQWALSRLRHPMHPHQTALCTERFKLIVIHGQTGSNELARYRLFDVQQDPGQLNDLANSETHQNQLEAMIDLMIDARVALEDRTEPRIANF